MFTRTRSSQAPKGSYHNYCRRKLEEHEIFSRTRCVSTAPRTASQTHRTRLNGESPSKSLTFEEYMERLNQQPFKQPLKMPPKTERKERTQAGQRTRGRTEQIIETHLPFFKCKLEKVETVGQRPDFRVKESKFRLNRNIVEDNQLGYTKSLYYGC